MEAPSTKTTSIWSDAYVLHFSQSSREALGYLIPVFLNWHFLPGPLWRAIIFILLKNETHPYILGFGCRCVNSAHCEDEVKTLQQMRVIKPAALVRTDALRPVSGQSTRPPGRTPIPHSVKARREMSLPPTLLQLAPAQLLSQGLRFLASWPEAL